VLAVSGSGHFRAEGPVDYRAVNQAGWDLLSLLDDPGPPDKETAREDLDPFGWIPWKSIRTVLCLAGAGGYFAPRFACLGYDVTVFDLSIGQLERDRQIGREEGLEISCIEGDVLDLSPLGGARFDLVYQPISACYIPDAAGMYRQVASVIDPSGLYFVKHWSPIQLQLALDRPWDGAAYRLDRPAFTNEPLIWRSVETWSGERASCVHHAHPLDVLIGGICDAGFQIVGFRQPDAGDVTAEPGSDAHMAAYLPPFLWVAARPTGS
jgi:hypothetical protein